MRSSIVNSEIVISAYLVSGVGWFAQIFKINNPQVKYQHEFKQSNPAQKWSEEKSHPTYGLTEV